MNPEAEAYANAVKIAEKGAAPETGELLDALVSVLRRFVILAPEQYDVVALWVLHAYAIDHADSTPYIHVWSPEKRSGKSRLLEVLDELVPRPLKAVNASPAAIFRSLAEAPPPTLLFDEIDTVFNPQRSKDSSEDLRGLINAGYRRGNPAIRCIGEGSSQTPVKFEVFGPKCLAGIGRLPDTIADRCLPIELRRKKTTEKVERGRLKTIRAAAAPIRAAAEAWLESVGDRLDVEPEIPPSFDDRTADSTEPVLAIADLCEGEWPERARKSILAIVAGKVADDDGSSWGVRLLAAIRDVFGEAEGMHSKELCEELRSDEEGPWRSWSKGAGIDPGALAKLLKPYGIHSKSVRVGERPAKGYKREQFEDAWDRYLAGTAPGKDPSEVTEVTSALASQKPSLFRGHIESKCDPSENGSNPHSNAVVTPVTSTGPKQGPVATKTPEAVLSATGCVSHSDSPKPSSCSYCRTATKEEK